MNRISVLTVLTHCLERVFRSNGFLMDEGHVQKSAKSDRNDYDYSDSYRSLNGLFQCDSPLKDFGRNRCTRLLHLMEIRERVGAHEFRFVK